VRLLVVASLLVPAVSPAAPDDVVRYRAIAVKPPEWMANCEVDFEKTGRELFELGLDDCGGHVLMHTREKQRPQISFRSFRSLVQSDIQLRLEQPVKLDATAIAIGSTKLEATTVVTERGQIVVGVLFEHRPNPQLTDTYFCRVKGKQPTKVTLDRCREALLALASSTVARNGPDAYKTRSN
jgi:hypothetical protein